MSPNLGVFGDAKYSSEIKTLQRLVYLNEVHSVAGQGSQAELKGLISTKTPACKRRSV